MYSLGNTSVVELVHYANIMGLRSRKGAPVSTNTIHYLLTNPFYYGEMRTFRGIMPHVYKPIITKELWDSCQEQKAIKAGNFAHYTERPFIFKGMITCGLTNRTCPCEMKKGKFIYVACWNKRNKRAYTREEELIKQISSILNRIKLPNDVVTELQRN